MKPVFSLFLLLFSSFSFAQTFTQEVTASGGGYYQQINGSMQFTIGEPITESYSTWGGKLCQGFEQGSYILLAVDEITVTPAISVDLFPNPSNGVFNVLIKADVNSLFNIKVQDAQGKMILDKEISANIREIFDLESYNSAMYFVTISNSEKQYLKTYKIIKQ